MNAQGLFSIGGIASGLDTDDIVTQLMALERQPVTRLEQRKASLEATRSAWGQITTKLSTLRAATDAMRRPDRFANLTSVSSSNEAAVSVSRNGRPDQQTELSFVVSQLAASHRGTFQDDHFAGLTATIGARELTITDANGVAHDLTAELGENATLGDLVNAINAADIGVRASTIQAQSGQHQLVLTGTDTGADNDFEVAGGGWASAFDVTRQAQDAVLDAGGVAITRSSNTITDLVEGATITLHQTTTSEVTVRAQQDVDGAVDAVRAFVDAVNATLDTIGQLTRFNPETREAGPLQGQFQATQLAANLRSAVTRPVLGLAGGNSGASALGLRSTADGRLSLDEARLREAFTNDFEGTAQRFFRAGQADPPEAATAVTGSRTVQAGTYSVEVAKAATVARATGAVYTPPGDAQPKNFMVRSANGTIVNLQIDTEDMTASQIAMQIRTKLDDAGFRDVEVTGTDVDGGMRQLEIARTRAGEAGSFEVYAPDFGFGHLDGEEEVWAAATGTNVEGTIGGFAATGSGHTLTATEGPAKGLAVTVATSVADDTSFNVGFWHGIAGALDIELSRAEGVSGSISRARNSLEGQMRVFQSRIEQFEERLASREVTLRRQFVGLETAIAQFNAQSQWLDGQINQLNAINTQAARRR